MELVKHMSISRFPRGRGSDITGGEQFGKCLGIQAVKLEPGSKSGTVKY